MRAWERHQHRTADLLRELGFTAEVNDPLLTTSGLVHKVDVSARIVLTGVGALDRRVQAVERGGSKREGVCAKDIVNDFAADRGLLMSQKGFQSGAVRLAAAKNITLSSLNELWTNAAEQLIAARVTATELRLLAWYAVSPGTSAPSGQQFPTCCPPSPGGSPKKTEPNSPNGPPQSSSGRASLSWRAGSAIPASAI